MYTQMHMGRPALGVAACWIIPRLVCVLLYYPGLTAWFYGDDFAWLNLAQRVSGWPELWAALFTPAAQGTVRTLSDRAYFLIFQTLFGLDALPYHCFVFLTQFGSIALIGRIVRRLGGSAATGACASTLWIVNASLALPLTKATGINQILCAFLLLLAFDSLLRYLETGLMRYEVLQWMAYILAFGALEIAVMYPLIVISFVFCVDRRYLRRSLTLLIPALAFTAAHFALIAKPRSGPYATYLDIGLATRIWTYWRWTVTPDLATSTSHLSAFAAIILLSALAAFVSYRAARCRNRAPLF